MYMRQHHDWLSRMVFQADAEGAGAASATDAGGAGAGSPGGSGEGAGAGAGAGGAGAGGDGGSGKSDAGSARGESLLDLARKSGDTGQGDKATAGGDAAGYRPEGVAENLIGSNDVETIDNLTKALKGFQRDASREGVPEDADGYAIKPTGDDDEVGNLLAENEALVPVLDTARAAALKAGMPMAMFDTFIREYAENGIDPASLASPEEKEQIRAREEFGILSKTYGDETRAKAVMQYVTAAGDDFVRRGYLSKEDLAAFDDAFGTAECTAVAYKLFSGLRGDSAMPVVSDSVGATGFSLSDAEGMMAEARALPAGPARDEAITKAEASFAKALQSPGARVPI